MPLREGRLLVSEAADQITAEALARLFKEKFDGDTDKINQFIRQARMLTAGDLPDEKFEPPIRTLGQYLDTDIEIPPVLIHPFMAVRGGLNVTVGRAGKGKTVMNLNRMLRWSAGLPMFDDWLTPDDEPILYPDEPLKILIVENEGAAGMFHRQIGIMSSQEEYLPGDARKLVRENMLIWGEGGYSHLKLDDPAKLEGLRRGIDKWDPDMVFIEPFRSLWAGEENSATEMQVVVDALVGIATDFNCGVWASHHEKKGGAGEDDKMSAARGSTVLEGIVTVMENFESVKGGDQREITFSKSRYEVPPVPTRMTWDNDAKWYKHVPADAIEDSVITYLMNNNDEPATIKELSEHLEETQTKLRRAMDQMVKDGKLKSMASQAMGNGGTTGKRYRLPSTDNGEKGLAI
jgi:RecA-family ATPase